ncbi:hypothetical protein HDU89_007697 [Geranomyces variabilis]|nr:hypothetical protein HDU89_007697 [Geranomyces variabilis]
MAGIRSLLSELVLNTTGSVLPLSWTSESLAVWWSAMMAVDELPVRSTTRGQNDAPKQLEAAQFPSVPAETVLSAFRRQYLVHLLAVDGLAADPILEGILLVLERAIAECETTQKMADNQTEKSEGTE